MKVNALAAVLFSVTLWGMVPVAMRYLVLNLSPEAAMLLRLYPAGVFAALLAIAIGVREIAWRDWMRIAFAALAGNVGYQVLAAFGAKTVPASWTGMLFGLEPVFIALFSVLFAGERLTGWLISGIVIAIAGTAWLMLGSSTTGGDVGLFGLILVAISTMGWGIYTVAIRPVSAKYGSFQTACLALAISAFPMLAFATPSTIGTMQSMTAFEWAVTAFLAIFATVLSTAAWNYALDHMKSSTAGMFLYMQPLVAAIGGILILGERPSWPLAIGGALIITGVAIAQLGPKLPGWRRTPARARVSS